MQKGFVPIILILVGIVILLLIGGAFYMGTRMTPADLKTEVKVIDKNINTPTQTKQSVSVQPTQTKLTPGVFEIPPLYAKIKWEKPDIFIKSRLDILMVDGKSTKLSGEYWIYKKSDFTTMQEFNEDQTGNSLQAYYDNALTTNGWGYEVTADNHTFSAVRADGGGSQVNAYLKYDSGKIRVFAIISSSTFARGEFPVDAQCPCTITHQVFISDVIEVDVLTK